MAKKQQREVVPPAKPQRRSHNRANYRHGTTLCKYCLRKIARGMAFCNKDHEKIFKASALPPNARAG